MILAGSLPRAPVLLGVALGAAHVPAQGFEEEIDELGADLGFLVVGTLVGLQVAGNGKESAHQDAGSRNAHAPQL